MADITATIVPKSDQLNADSLLTGPITILITSVDVNPGTEQPVVIHYEGEKGRPYKPGLSMRRVIAHVWGKESVNYPGKSMTLYCDPAVRFGGLDVGGIRISHMSHMDREATMALTASKGNKKPFKVKPLKDAPRGSSGGAGQANGTTADQGSQKTETASSEPRRASTEPWDVWADKAEAERDGFTDRAKLIEWWNLSSKTPDWATLKEKNPARAEGLKGGVTKKAAELAAKADEL